MNILSRRCGAPTSAARRVVHCASNPAWARSARTRSSPRVRRRPTFSTTTSSGRTSPMARANENQSRLRRPASPCRVPALLMSWQGNPPHKTLASGKCWTRSRFPRFGTSGHHRRKTWHAYGSTSLWKTTSPPRTASTARSSPPIPEKREPISKAPSPCLPLLTASPTRCDAGASPPRRPPSPRAWSSDRVRPSCPSQRRW